MAAPTRDLPIRQVRVSAQHPVVQHLYWWQIPLPLQQPRPCQQLHYPCPGHTVIRPSECSPSR
ncbi:hypothetical protein B0H14DRAFT_3124211 [Mycena olivaceomarginata]|nr:hypothetical protein B0H14DRAFT_3124211 [Mycena olivaceomarginata]